MFKGRFGDFYLIKVWIFILVIGSIIFPFLHFKLKSESKLMIGIIEFIFFEIFLRILPMDNNASGDFLFHYAPDALYPHS